MHMKSIPYEYCGIHEFSFWPLQIIKFFGFDQISFGKTL
jgi:hypothetical protein